MKTTKRDGTADDHHKLFSSLVDSLPEQLAIIDQSGTIRLVNQAWVEFGRLNGCTISPTNWIGISYLDTCEAAARKGDKFGAAAANLIRQVITAELDSSELTYPCHAPNKSRWFRMRIWPLRWNGPPYFIISHQNVTVHTEAEHALGKSEERFAKVFRTSPHPIGITEVETGRCIEVNDTCLQLFGFSREEVIGSTTLTLGIWPDPNERVRLIEHLRTEGPVRNMEVCLKTKSGALRNFLISCDLVELNKAMCLITVGLDITEQKAADLKLAQAAHDLEVRNVELAEAHARALHATHAKSEFLASMSHEIRTPMNAIIGMAELLQETPLTPDQANYVGRFSRAAMSLMDLINAILDLSKIEAGYMTMESVPFDLPQLIDSISEIMTGKAQSKGLELLVVIHPNVPRGVIGDPTRLKQVLLNLVGNAVKFTESGHVLIQVEPVHDRARAHTLHFSVSDTGIGIPTEKLQNVFEVFTQVDSTTTRKYGGTGLGLNISKQLIELMGGAIEVDSTIGVGTTFSFTLDMPEAPLLETERQPRYLDLHGRRLLIVDDNDTNLMILSKHLTHAGVHIEEAASGATALAILEEAADRNELFDLVIVDYHMPAMNGLDLVEAIRARPALATLPIIMHASDLSRRDARRAKSLDIASYLSKPLSRQRLMESLTIALNLLEPAEDPHPPIDSHESYSLLSPRILLVEDLEDNRDVVSLFLKDTSCQLEFAENGAVALKKFKECHYDLILMDMQMPIMDGLQATTAIREWEREQARGPTPIVALTANAFKEEADKCLAAGCTAHVTKPIRKKTLLSVIRQCAGKPRDQAA